MQPVAAQHIAHGKELLRKHKNKAACRYRNKYSAKQRRQFYPYNITDTVKLVSFRYHKNNYPVQGNSLVIDSLIESKSLTDEDITKLTDIFFNSFYKTRPDYGSLKQCFFPRNAILFFNNQGMLKSYILICFHCSRYERSSDEIYMGDNCTEKMEMLRQFFISKGVEFGAGMNNVIYPGEVSDE